MHSYVYNILQEIITSRSCSAWDLIFFLVNLLNTLGSSGGKWTFMYEFGNCRKMFTSPYNGMFNTVLVGLKLFQDIIVGSVSEKSTRINSSFLRMTETGCRITASSAYIFEMVLSIGQKRGIFTVQHQRQSKVNEKRSNEKCIICYNLWTSPELPCPKKIFCHKIVRFCTKKLNSFKVEFYFKVVTMAKLCIMF